MEVDSDSPPPSAGRIVGHYVLKLEYSDLSSSKINAPVQDIWAPIEVSAETADFLSLGCRLPGEVRFHSASLNVEHLRPITLARTPVGADREFDVEVRFDGATNEKSHALLEWINHNQSPYYTSSSESIEETLNPFLKSPKGDSIFESLKMRRPEHPLMETTPFTPAYPTLLFRSAHSYSMESLHYTDNDDYDDEDDHCYPFYDSDNSDYGYGQYDPDDYYYN